MNRCKDCKYFCRNKKQNQKDITNTNYGSCENSKFIYGGSYETQYHNDTQHDLVFYEDYEGYNADLEVGENFGCVHFQNKEI